MRSDCLTDAITVRLKPDTTGTTASISWKKLETFRTREGRWTEAMKSAFALNRYGATAFACICEGWLAEP